jgi:hypothetical protein
MPFRKIPAVVFALGLLAGMSACNDDWARPLAHYQISSSGDGLRAFVVDQQTGEVRFCTVSRVDESFGCDTMPSPSIPMATSTPGKSK